TYKVQPSSSGFQFYVDGTLQTTITASFQTTVSLKSVLSAFNGASAPALQADWVHFDSYSTSRSGTFTSTVFDAGQTAHWDSVTWTADLPAGTSITVETMTSVDGVTWSNWAASVNSVIASPSGRYIRYRVTLTTTDPTVSPVLKDISFTWS